MRRTEPADHRRPRSESATATSARGGGGEPGDPFALKVPRARGGCEPADPIPAEAGSPLPVDHPAPSADRIIATLAGAQHGVVSRCQLRAAGVSDRKIGHRLATGRLERLRPGVYRSGPVRSRHEREAAALCACPGAVLSFKSAGTLFALADAPKVVELSATAARRLTGVRVHRVRSLPADEITTVEGLAVTTPARTLLDLASCLPVGELERCAARADREGLLPKGALDTLLARYPRRHGTRVLTRLLRQEGGLAFTRSEAETRFLELVRSAGLPVPHFNQRLAGLEVDALWAGAKLVIEIDGRAWHGDARAFEHDRLRDSALAAAGYRVMRVTWEQLTRAPNALLVRLARALYAGAGASSTSAANGPALQRTR